MSSSIRIEKICEYCKKEYTAKTVYTRYCSHICNRKACKLYKLKEKVDGAKRTLQVNPSGKLRQTFDYSTIQNKKLLTIKEACALLSITHVTLRRWLKEGVIKSSRIGKKHLIRRSQLNKLL